MSDVPLSTVLLAPTTLALRPDPTTVPVNAIIPITDEGYKQYQNLGGQWVQYSPAAVVTSLQILTADPSSPSDDTWWVVRTGTSPGDALEIRGQVAGTIYTIASVTL
jgi:hypothetical protein